MILFLPFIGWLLCDSHMRCWTQLHKRLLQNPAGDQDNGEAEDDDDDADDGGDDGDNDEYDDDDDGGDGGDIFHCHEHN